MDAIKHGQQLYFRDKHYSSVLPSEQLANAINGRRTETSQPIARSEKLNPFTDLAFPDAKTRIEPIALVSFAKCSLSGFMPQWISKIVPRMEWLDSAAALSLDAPEQYALISPHMAAFAPTIEDGWLVAPLLVFQSDGCPVGQPITLMDHETDEEVLQAKLPETGQGYITNARILILGDR